MRESSPYSLPTVIALLSMTVFVGGVLVSACDSGGGGGGGIAGTYSLTSLNLDGDDVSSERIDGAQLTIEEDGTWNGFLEVDDDDVEADPATAQGEYTVNEQTVIFSLDETNVEGESRLIGITGEVHGGGLSVEIKAEGDDYEAEFEKN